MDSTFHKIWPEMGPYGSPRAQTLSGQGPISSLRTYRIPRLTQIVCFQMLVEILVGVALEYLWLSDQPWGTSSNQQIPCGDSESQWFEIAAIPKSK